MLLYELRPVHTTKIMRIKCKLIRIVTVHTKCALTAIRFEIAFNQSTSIGGLKADWAGFTLDCIIFMLLHLLLYLHDWANKWKLA